MQTQFSSLARGAQFRFQGQLYRKTALSMAEELTQGPRLGWGCVFMAHTVVETEPDANATVAENTSTLSDRR